MPRPGPAGRVWLADVAPGATKNLHDTAHPVIRPHSPHP